MSIAGSLAVSRVDFYADGNLIGADSGAPYSISWDTRRVGNGSHTLTAVAQDMLRARWTSNAVSVSVANDITRPAVSVNQAAAQPDPTNAAPINFTVLFSEPVSGFTGTDVTLGGIAASRPSPSMEARRIQSTPSAALRRGARALRQRSCLRPPVSRLAATPW